MINCQIINRLYRCYNKPPQSIDCLDIPLLFEETAAHHGIHVDIESTESTDSILTINSIGTSSPFRRIPMKRINAIIPFEKWVAIILPNSIIFLSKRSPEVYVHLKPEKPGILDRLAMAFGRYKSHCREEDIARSGIENI